MIKSIAELGKMYPNDDKYLKNPFDNKKKKYLISIDITCSNNEYSYSNVSFIKELDKEDNKKILHSKGSPNGPNQTPSAEVTEADKTVTKKIIAFFYDHQNKNLKKIYPILKSNQEDITNKVTEKLKEYEKLVLTIRINEKFLDEISEIDFKSILLQKQAEKTGNIHSDKFCCICHTNKGLLDKKQSPFPFFTDDKPGYTYGLDKKNSYKMLPICPSCYDNLCCGKIKLNEQNFNFYGNKYLLIPKLFNSNDKAIISKLIDELPRFKIDYKNKANIQDEYENIFRHISRQNNSLSFFILFFNAPKGIYGSELKINKIIEDIFPSQFKELYEEIDTANNTLTEVCSFNSKEGKKSILFSFRTVKDFFDDNEEFIQITYDIFIKNKLQYENILRKICLQIRKQRNIEDQNTFFDTLSGLLLLYFLKERGIINFSKGDTMQQIKSEFDKNEIVRKLIEFFSREEHKQFFNSYEKIGVFSTGVLIGKLLMVQRNNLNNSTPFYHKMKNFKLKKEEIPNLYKDACDKLRQYDDEFESYHDLKSFIAEIFPKSGVIKEWKISNDEANFYLALGLNLSPKFRIIKEDEKNEHNK